MPTDDCADLISTFSEAELKAFHEAESDAYYFQEHMIVCAPRSRRPAKIDFEHRITSE
jgi:hypothetical protein